ncbi:MAG: hypothetical protein MRJ96_11920 [Nitrospirales bacterium]|nr:hypothetical protein [Nitrospira sp.]MDR4502147.1 hypothetical protein [Nitrospirales bacterium]
MSWEVEILGDETVLRALGKALEDQEWIIMEKDGHFVLTGPVFTKFTDAESVREHGKKIIQSLSGMARLLLGTEKKISPGAVFEITENGGKNIFITPDPVVLKLSASMAVSAIVISKDGKIIEESRPADPAPAILKKSLAHEVVERALRLRNEDDLDWVKLYRLFEVIESDVPIDVMVANGWASRNKISLFKQTANSQKALGDQARHGKDPCLPPPKPMKISEAREMIDALLKKWLLGKEE